MNRMNQVLPQLSAFYWPRKWYESINIGFENLERINIKKLSIQIIGVLCDYLIKRRTAILHISIVSGNSVSSFIFCIKLEMKDYSSEHSKISIFKSFD